MDIKKQRLKVGLSRKQLASACDISERMLQKYELGINDIKNAKSMTLYKMSIVLRCRMEDFMK